MGLATLSNEPRSLHLCALSTCSSLNRHKLNTHSFPAPRSTDRPRVPEASITPFLVVLHAGHRLLHTDWLPVFKLYDNRIRENPFLPVKWELTVVFICISWMTRDVKSLLIFPGDVEIWVDFW